MMDLLAGACLLLGGFFFFAGTVGLLRLPDIYTRLHGLTKADNVGLGLIVAGLALRSGSPAVAAKMVLIWGLVLVASSSVAHLVAMDSLRRGAAPWRRR